MCLIELVDLTLEPLLHYCIELVLARASFETFITEAILLWVCTVYNLKHVFKLFMTGAFNRFDKLAALSESLEDRLLGVGHSLVI